MSKLDFSFNSLHDGNRLIVTPGIITVFSSSSSYSSLIGVAGGVAVSKIVLKSALTLLASVENNKICVCFQ
ncbi:unnamed protein product [Schistosoma mattheei]|uniref:Uncharacterized protein n=1 Tax=Schistosoma mattheei TaxID=31246 RepID=A0A183P130_9TREM|nr:unnamed protein product [Schistosoma mattheei]